MSAGPPRFLRQIEPSASLPMPVAAEENRDPHRRFAVASRSLTRPRPPDAPDPVIQDRQAPNMQIISHAAADNAAYFAAVACAKPRALTTYFSQPAPQANSLGYLANDEGANGAQGHPTMN